MVPMWWLEWDLNLLPSGRKAPNLPLSHDAPLHLSAPAPVLSDLSSAPVFCPLLSLLLCLSPLTLPQTSPISRTSGMSSVKFVTLQQRYFPPCDVSPVKFVAALSQRFQMACSK